MSKPTTETRSVIVERDMPFPPEKIWRALTQPHLIEAWLMKTDFKPVVGDPFTFSGDWGSVDGRVLEVEAGRSLSYSWEAFGLESVVTWTLTPTDTGTHLRMEQSGFRPEQAQFHQGAQASWPGFLAKLEQVVAGLD
jgi:uncharacterized protein YndB with AHSA1/START domain